MSQAVKCKEIAYSHEPSEAMQPCQHLDFGTSDLQGRTIITSCYLHFVVICYSSNRKLLQIHQLFNGKHQQRVCTKVLLIPCLKISVFFSLPFPQPPGMLASLTVFISLSIRTILILLKYQMS